MISRDRLLEILDYSAETGEFRWRVSGHSRVAGALVGSPTNHGYLTVRVDYRPYYCHRLAWFYVHGRWPAGQIDHVNCNGHDNRIANLREATQTQNNGNLRRRKDNKSGFKGVSWDKRLRCWVAQVHYQGRHYHLGGFDTPEAAQAAYAAGAARFFGGFARVG